MDQVYQRAMEFAKNLNAKKGSMQFSNIYVVQKVDAEGNVIDEKYGHNLMTDYGANQFFVNGTDFPTNFYIGNGSSAFNISMKAMISPITTSAAITNSSPATTTIDYAYPLYYDSYTGWITTICRKQICYFDYNIADIGSTITISEYGIGSDVNNLWTHSWVYDNLGQRTTITKKVNERLIIHVYFAMTYNESLINDAWDAGKYILITTMQKFMNKMIPNGVYTYKRNNAILSRTFSNGTSTFADNVVSKYQTAAAFDIYSGSENTQGYIEGFANWYSGFNMIERDLLSSNESFTSIQFAQSTYKLENDALTYNFGHASYLPFTTLQVQHAYSYNYLTGVYDTEEVFVQDPDKWYCETPMETSFYQTIYFTSNNTIVSMYVYRNIHNSDPIISVGTVAESVYATDKYWDCSSWVLITDHNNIPAAVQHAKYWITNSNTLNLNPKRGNTPFMIKPLTNEYSRQTYFTTFQPKISMVYSYFDHGIFAQGGKVYRTTGAAGLYLFNQLNRLNQNKIYGCGDMVINASTGNVNVLSYMNMAEQTPTAQTIAIDNTKISNMFTAYTTETETGFVLFQQNTSCLKVDIRNNSISTTMMDDIKIASCVWNTNNYCYISSVAGEERVVYVKSLVDNSSVQTFTLSASVNAPTFIYGYQNWVYISDGSTYTYVGDISQGTLTSCSAVLPWGSLNLQYVRATHTDRCMLLYLYNVSGAGGVYILRNDTPATITTYTEISSLDYREALRMYTLRNWYGTIILLENYDRSQNSNTWNRVCDFGRYLHDNTTTYYSEGYEVQWLPYGTEHIIRGNKSHLLFNMIGHKLVGTFTTISAYNNIKHVSGKQWVTQLTNIPTYSGLPPGVRQ